jgi:uncharacterized membrane protein
MNPFDVKSALLARHAQHVVLIHFPIALFIAGVAFDVIARWTRRRGFADAAYYNLLVAALSTVPVIATGLLAWQFALEGQKVKGILLMHMVMAAVSTVIVWTTWWMQWRVREGRAQRTPFLIGLEVVGVALIALTGHLGGFLSGVNAPG